MGNFLAMRSCSCHNWYPDFPVPNMELALEQRKRLIEAAWEVDKVWHDPRCRYASHSNHIPANFDPADPANEPMLASHTPHTPHKIEAKAKISHESNTTQPNTTTQGESPLDLPKIDSFRLLGSRALIYTNSKAVARELKALRRDLKESIEAFSKSMNHLQSQWKFNMTTARSNANEHKHIYTNQPTPASHEQINAQLQAFQNTCEAFHANIERQQYNTALHTNEKAQRELERLWHAIRSRTCLSQTDSHKTKTEPMPVQKEQQPWTCDACGSSGTVSFSVFEGAWEVKEQISTAHNQVNPECHEENGLHKVRCDQPEIANHNPTTDKPSPPWVKQLLEVEPQHRNHTPEPYSQHLHGTPAVNQPQATNQHLQPHEPTPSNQPNQPLQPQAKMKRAWMCDACDTSGIIAYPNNPEGISVLKIFELMEAAHEESSPECHATHGQLHLCSVPAPDPEEPLPTPYKSVLAFVSQANIGIKEWAVVAWIDCAGFWWVANSNGPFRLDTQGFVVNHWKPTPNSEDFKYLHEQQNKTQSTTQVPKP